MNTLIADRHVAQAIIPGTVFDPTVSLSIRGTITNLHHSNNKGQIAQSAVHMVVKREVSCSKHGGVKCFSYFCWTKLSKFEIIAVDFFSVLSFLFISFDYMLLAIVCSGQFLNNGCSVGISLMK